ncbi:MAG: GntR family transcriptional regulator [Lachnospiraceae bacterium]|nr:GntR family transcriptional regulator [Lachnospiraceae bacterium]
MYIEIDFNSEEAYYMQLRNRIIEGIATGRIIEGEALPSVRKMSEDIGINMHTVNKAYTLLKDEGFVKVDRRRGAVVSVDSDHILDIDRLKKELNITIAGASCKGISRDELITIVDEILKEYGGEV